MSSGKSPALKRTTADETRTTEEPLSRYHVVEKLQESDEQQAYLADDTKLHRSVEISVLPESAARQGERRQRLQQRALLATSLLVVLAVVLLTVQWLRGPAPAQPQPLRRFAFTPESLHSGPFGRVVISPDGKHIVYLGSGDMPKLWVREIDREQPRELAGETKGDRHPNS